MMRIGINGFGRIGRALFRNLVGNPLIEVAAINDLAPPQELGHFLQYDSFVGKWSARVRSSADTLSVGDLSARCFRTPLWESIPWTSLNVDLVVEATRSWRTRRDLARHLDAGVKRVVVTANCPDSDIVVVQGFNDESLLEDARIIAAASCTTQCLTAVVAPIVNVMQVSAIDFTVIHQVSADQPTVDVVGNGPRRGRSALTSIIPLATTASTGLERLFPSLIGKVTGMVVRVPTTAVSLAIVNLVTERHGNLRVLDEVHSLLRSAESPALRVTDLPLVSIDYAGDEHSAIVDVTLSRSSDPRSFTLGAWFDNEAGYVSRLTELLEAIAVRQW
jgi:glyceraldehyde 3-phosphate dehydrogenase